MGKIDTRLNLNAFRALLVAMNSNGATMTELMAATGISCAQIKRILAIARAEFGMAFRVGRPEWRYRVAEWGALSPCFVSDGERSGKTSPG